MNGPGWEYDQWTLDKGTCGCCGRRWETCRCCSTRCGDPLCYLDQPHSHGTTTGRDWAPSDEAE